jgi:hypothetical protein
VVIVLVKRNPNLALKLLGDVPPVVKVSVLGNEPSHLMPKRLIPDQMEIVLAQD